MRHIDPKNPDPSFFICLIRIRIGIRIQSANVKKTWRFKCVNYAKCRTGLVWKYAKGWGDTYILKGRGRSHLNGVGEIGFEVGQGENPLGHASIKAKAIGRVWSGPSS
jgi:hypothetical protein